MNPRQASLMVNHDDKGNDIWRHRVIKEYQTTECSARHLAKKYDINKKTILKWIKREGIVVRLAKKNVATNVERVVWESIEQRDAEIVRQYVETSRGCELIARSLGISKKTAYKVLEHKNIKRINKIKKVDVEILKKDYESGLSSSDLSKKHDLSEVTVHKNLMKAGCTLRAAADTNSIIPINLQNDVVKWYVDEDLSTYDVSDRLKKRHNVDAHPNSIQKFINRRGVMRRGQAVRDHVARKQKNKNYKTKIEGVVEGMLKEMGVKYDWQYPIDGWTYDFRCGDVLIEVNGDYWHSLPGRRQRDAKKFDVARERNMKVCYIWEHEIKANAELVRDRLKHVLIGVPSFDFKSCIVKATSFNDVEKFLDEHHYQGSGRSGTTCVGCYDGNDLVAVVTFGSVVRLEMAEKQNLSTDEVRELMRLCIKPEKQSKNFATWLLARARRILRMEEPGVKLLISFSDPNFGHVGTIYEADNWRFDGETSSSYWYVDSRSVIVHKKTIWNRAMKNGVTEREQAKSDNLVRVEARPKRRFIRTP